MKRQAFFVCQVGHRNLDMLACPVEEGGGYQCERMDRHPIDGQHWIGEHTITHALAGNGWSCFAEDGLPFL